MPRADGGDHRRCGRSRCPRADRDPFGWPVVASELVWPTPLHPLTTLLLSDSCTAITGALRAPRIGTPGNALEGQRSTAMRDEPGFRTERKPGGRSASGVSRKHAGRRLVPGRNTWWSFARPPRRMRRDIGEGNAASGMRPRPARPGFAAQRRSDRIFSLCSEVWASARPLRPCRRAAGAKCGRPIGRQAGKKWHSANASVFVLCCAIRYAVRR